jgi:hypothetical protein
VQHVRVLHPRTGRLSRGHSIGGRGRIVRLSITAGTAAKADFVVKVTLEQQPEVIVSPGAGPVTYPGATSTVNDIYLSWKGSQWQAIEITRPA